MLSNDLMERKRNDEFVNGLLEKTKNKEIKWEAMNQDNFNIIDDYNKEQTYDGQIPYQIKSGYSTKMLDFDICIDQEEFYNVGTQFTSGIYIFKNRKIIKVIFGGILSDKTSVDRLFRLIDRDGLDENEVLDSLIKYLKTNNIKKEND